MLTALTFRSQPPVVFKELRNLLGLGRKFILQGMAEELLLEQKVCYLLAEERVNCATDIPPRFHIPSCQAPLKRESVVLHVVHITLARPPENLYQLTLTHGFHLVPDLASDRRVGDRLSEIITKLDRYRNHLVPDEALGLGWLI